MTCVNRYPFEKRCSRMFFSDFFSEVLNLNKFLRIFIFLRIWAILNRQNSLQNYNKDEKNKRKTKKKIRPKFSHVNVNKTKKFLTFAL